MSFLFLKPDSSSQEYGTNIFTYTMPVQPGSIYYLGAVNTVGIYDKDYTSANGFLGEWAGGSNISSVAPYTLVLHSRAGATAMDWDGTIAYLPAAAAVAVAPTNAQYITLAADPTLTNERVLTAGSNITLNAGTPGVLTISAASGAVGAPTTAQYLTLAADPGLANERVLTAGANVTLDAAVPGVLTINAAGGATGAPTTAQYLTLAADPGLTNERVLTAGTNVTLDAAVPGVLTINSASSFANHKARVLLNLPQTVGTSNNTVIFFDLEIYDPNNNFANARYTVPSTGYYYVAVSAAVSNADLCLMTVQNSVGPVSLFQFYLNPVSKGAATQYSTARSDILFLAAGAEIQLLVANTSAPYDVTGAALTVHRIS